MTRVLWEIEFGSLKSMITDGGHASAERIAERLAMPLDRLVRWLELPEHGFDIGPAERAALDSIRRSGISVGYREYVAQLRLSSIA